MSLSERYFPNEDELLILVPGIRAYFKQIPRSSGRKKINIDVYEALKARGHTHWSLSNVRLWFNNNKQAYVDDPLSEIPNEVSNPAPEKPVARSSPPAYDLDPINMILAPLISTDSVLDQNNNATIVTPQNVSETQSFSLDDADSVNFIPELIVPIPEETPEDTPEDIPPTPDEPPPKVKLPVDMFEEYSPIPQHSTDVRIMIHEEEENENEFAIPSVPSTGDDFDIDNAKYLHYSYLNDLYGLIHNAATFEKDKRLGFQEQIEKCFTDCVSQMHTKLHIADICTIDKKGKVIEAKLTKSIDRLFSITTVAYASDRVVSTSSNVDLEETSKFVFIPKMTRFPSSISQEMHNFHRGESNFEESQLSCAELYIITPSGNCITVGYSKIQRAYVIKSGDIVRITGFYREPTSIAYIDGKVWVAGDQRIASFDENTLERIDLFNIGRLLQESCISGWGFDTLVIGFEDQIGILDLSIKHDTSKKVLQTGKASEFARIHGLDLDLIDWTPGKTGFSFFTCDISPVTSIAAVDDYLAVASSWYHGIHVFNREHELVGRLIGHTAGITSLISFPEGKFISGSKDFTCKVWDTYTMTPEMHISRHGGPVSCLFAASYLGNSFLFSGGADKCVRAWNLTKCWSMFEIHTEDLPNYLYFNNENGVLEIITEPNAAPVYPIPTIDEKNVKKMSFTFIK